MGQKPVVVIATDKVSIIVSTYTEKRIDDLLDCIESVKKQSFLPHEIIVVLDSNEQLIKSCQRILPKDVKIVVSDGFGLSLARNSGVKTANGNIVAFIDDDAVAERQWLEKLMENYSDSQVIGVGGIAKPLWVGKNIFWLPPELYWIIGCSYKGLPEIKSNIRNPIGCNMSFKKEVFSEIGFFNVNVGRFGKRLLAGEEAEISLRISDKFADSKLIFDPSALVYHKVSTERLSFGYLIRRSYYEGLSKALIVSSTKTKKYALNTESSYMIFLLKYSIPSRIKRFYNPKNLAHILVILSSSFFVILGYFSGRLQSIMTDRD